MEKPNFPEVGKLTDRRSWLTEWCPSEFRNSSVASSRLPNAAGKVIATLQRMLFGQKSERIVANDAQLIIPGMESLLANDEKKPEEKQHVKEHDRNIPAGQPNAGWNGFPESLPREELIIEAPVLAISNFFRKICNKAASPLPGLG